MKSNSLIPNYCVELQLFTVISPGVCGTAPWQYAAKMRQIKDCPLHFESRTLFLVPCRHALRQALTDAGAASAPKPHKHCRTGAKAWGTCIRGEPVCRRSILIHCSDATPMSSCFSCIWMPMECCRGVGMHRRVLHCRGSSRLAHISSQAPPEPTSHRSSCSGAAAGGPPPRCEKGGPTAGAVRRPAPPELRRTARGRWPQSPEMVPLIGGTTQQLAEPREDAGPNSAEAEYCVRVLRRHVRFDIASGCRMLTGKQHRPT